MNFKKTLTATTTAFAMTGSCALAAGQENCGEWYMFTLENGQARFSSLDDTAESRTHENISDIEIGGENLAEKAHTIISLAAELHEQYKQYGINPRLSINTYGDGDINLSEGMYAPNNPQVLIEYYAALAVENYNSGDLDGFLDLSNIANGFRKLDQMAGILMSDMASSQITELTPPTYGNKPSFTCAGDFHPQKREP